MLRVAGLCRLCRALDVLGICQTGGMSACWLPTRSFPLTISVLQRSVAPLSLFLPAWVGPLPTPAAGRSAAAGDQPPPWRYGCDLAAQCCFQLVDRHTVCHSLRPACSRLFAALGPRRRYGMRPWIRLPLEPRERQGSACWLAFEKLFGLLRKPEIGFEPTTY